MQRSQPLERDLLCCRPVLLLGALRQERRSGSLAVMALVEAAASVICQPGVQTTDPIILSSMLQVHCTSVCQLVMSYALHVNNWPPLVVTGMGSVMGPKEVIVGLTCVIIDACMESTCSISALSASALDP